MLGNLKPDLGKDRSDRQRFWPGVGRGLEDVQRVRTLPVHGWAFDGATAGWGSHCVNLAGYMGGIHGLVGIHQGLHEILKKIKKALCFHRALISFTIFGSSTWARTRDLRINSPALYRLSYRGINRFFSKICANGGHFYALFCRKQQLNIVAKNSYGLEFPTCPITRQGNRTSRLTLPIRGRGDRSHQGWMRKRPSHGGVDAPSADDRYSHAKHHQAPRETGALDFRQFVSEPTAHQVRLGRKRWATDTW
jgi:hypothetical protein